MGKALRTAGAIVGAIALVATGVGALALGGFAGTLTLGGVSVATLGQIGVGLSMAGSLVEGKPQVGGSSGTPTAFKADPSAGIPVAIDRVGTGGNIVLQATTGEKGKYLNLITVHSLGPIQGYESFSANGEVVPFTTPGRNGEEAAGRYLNRMWRVQRLGTASQTAMAWSATGSKDTPADHGGNVTGFWTANHRLRSLACTLWGLEFDASVYATGVPKPLDVVLGPAVYDPREDSTYPGGNPAGPQRIDDEDTWSFVGRDNPALQALTFAIGRRREGILVAGIGLSPAAIDIAAHVEGANICDANGWKIAGLYYTTDPKYDVYRAMLMTGGGVPVPMGDRLGCMFNAPRVSLDTITADDLAGGFTLQGATSRRGRPNQVIPRVLSEAHGWEVVPVDPVTIDDYVTADGRLVPREIEYKLCPNADQGAQLATYEAVNARELGPVVMKLKPRWGGYKSGDCVTINDASIGLVNQPMLIFRHEDDFQSGAVTLTMRSETAAKHDFCLGRTASPPPVPGLAADDPSQVTAPHTDDWVATGATLTDNGVSIPAIVIVGEMSNPHVTKLLVRYRPTGATDWTMHPAVDLVFDEEVRVELTGLTPETTYELSIAYRSVRGVPSVWTALDDVVAGSYAFDTLGTEDGLLTVYYQDAAPTAPERGDVWFDTNAGNAPWQWDGLAWVDASDNAAVQAIQFATAAQATANTKILTFYQTTTPTALAVGDLWVDTDDATRRVYRWNGSSWLVIADQTGFNIAAGFTGQGALATLSVVDWATKVTGVGKPEDYANKSLVYKQTSPPTGATNDVWIRTDGSGNGLDLWVYNGSGWISGADRTPYNIAMGITGQGPWATASVPSGLTPTVIGGRTQYLDSNGQVYSYRGLYWGYSVGVAAGRNASPLSSDVGSASCAAHTIYLYRQGYSTGYPISVSGHTASGLADDMAYTWFYRPDYGDHFCVFSGYAPSYVASQDGYMLIGDIKTPASSGYYVPPGSTSPDPGTAFDGNYDAFRCVAVSAFLASGQVAGDAKVGDALTLMAPAGDRVLSGAVEAMVIGVAECLTFTTSLGAVLTLSESTPIMTRKGAGFTPRAVRASVANVGLSVPILTEDGELVWDDVTAIAPAGRQPVAHISAKGIGVFAASDHPTGPRLFTHNMWNKVPE